MKQGDSVELFAVDRDRWVYRGSGTIQHCISETMAIVARKDAHPVAASSTPRLFCTVMVAEIPLGKNCQCLLPPKPYYEEDSNAT